MADPRCRQWAPAKASGLAPAGLENDESGWGDPWGTKADANHRFNDAIQRSEELGFRRALDRLFRSHLAS
jgi:hypothetical protein